jgi:hypothetical protein
MQTPDIILAGAGIVLFIVLIILLFQRKIEGKTAFLLFFMVVIMIGYPTIKKITVDDEMVEIVKYSDQITANPQNSAAAANQLNAVLEKPWAIGALKTDPARLKLATNALTVAASARVVNNDVPAAQTYLNKAKVLTPNSSELQFVQHHLDTVKSSAAPQQRTASKTILTEKYHLAR